MSMHEIEDTVEGSVRVLHEHDGASDLRDLFFGLFEFQSGCDCSFTHGRVLPILVARRFAYCLPVTSHPRYEEKKAAFDSAPRDETLFVASEIFGEEPPEDGPAGVGHENGYLVDGALYCDAGSPLWTDLVRAGALTGADAIAPRPPLLGALAMRVVLAAEKAKDADLVAMWMNFGPQILFGSSFKRSLKKGDVLGKNPFTGETIIVEDDREVDGPVSVEGLVTLEAATVMRDVGRRMKIGDVEVAYDHRSSRENWSAAEKWFWSA
jgi:hypothetical protein